jgi:transposase InsO family protein
MPVTRWDYLTLSYSLSKHSEDIGSLGPFSEGALLDLWDHLCPNELELAHQGVHVGRNRVARLMVAAGLVGRCRRRTRTTIADPETRAMNLLARAFGPENLTLDTVWAGDITYVRTWEGWLTWPP